MSETFRCGDYESLVAYLYDECEPAARDAITAHVAVCAPCAEELEALGGAREALSSWTPPDARLGFQITERHEGGGARVLTPPVAAWWRRPLPAWAQMAAAVAIFATGLAIGVARSQPAAIAPPIAASARPAATQVVPAGVTAQDLDAVEQRLRGEIAQVRRASTQPVAARNDAELLRRVQTMINDSEQRQRRELAVQTAQVMRSVDAQRRIDLAQVQRNIGQIQDVAGAAVRGQAQMVNYLMNVSQQR